MLCVERYGKVATFEKVVLRNRWNRYERDRVVHARGVHIRSENGDLVIGCSEGFDTLERLLPIIQSWCHSMYAEVGIFNEFWLTPFPGLGGVVGFDVAIDY